MLRFALFKSKERLIQLMLVSNICLLQHYLQDITTIIKDDIVLEVGKEETTQEVKYFFLIYNQSSIYK